MNDENVIEEPTNQNDDNDKNVNSILLSIKKLLGIDSSFSNFDPDIILHINSVFTNLKQLGVGPKDGFRITGGDEEWSDFINDEKQQLDAVRTYMYLKVKLVFDPPLNGSVMESMKETIKELEWRLINDEDRRS